VSDGERGKNGNSPPHKGHQLMPSSQDHTFIKDDGIGSLGVLVDNNDNYVDDMKKGTSNILVAVRLRPLWQREKEQDHFEIVKILDQKVSLPV